MRSDRDSQSGIILLEALVSFGLAAIVVGFSILIFGGSATQQARRVYDLNAAEFAMSLAEEYRATFPLMDPKGEHATGWQWRISERSVAPDGQTSLDEAMGLVEIQLDVWHRDRPDQTRRFFTIVARPRL